MIRFGMTPPLWHPDEAPEAPFEALLDDIAAAGFTGTELTDRFPRHPLALKAALASRGLALSGAPFFPGLTDPAAVEAAFADLDDYLDFLASAGCQAVIAFEPEVPVRAKAAGRVRQSDAPTLTDAEWETLADALDQLGLRCKQRGLALAFEPRAGTFVETPLEVKRLMNLTDPGLVGLCLDTGHYVLGGGDPLEVIDTYMLRLRCIRLRDVDLKLKRTAVAVGAPLGDMVRKGVFPPLGQGSVDAPAIARRLQAADWDGWIVVEPAPTTSASVAERRALAAAFGEPAPVGGERA